MWNRPSNYRVVSGVGLPVTSQAPVSAEAIAQALLPRKCTHHPFWVLQLLRWSLILRGERGAAELPVAQCKIQRLWLSLADQNARGRLTQSSLQARLHQAGHLECTSLCKKQTDNSVHVLSGSVIDFGAKRIAAGLEKRKTTSFRPTLPHSSCLLAFHD